MFEVLGVIIEIFVYCWILIIASIPNLFMGGLTIAVLGTLITYFERSRQEQQ